MQNVSSSKGPACCANTHLQAPLNSTCGIIGATWRGERRRHRSVLGIPMTRPATKNRSIVVWPPTFQMPLFLGHTAGTPCLITPERRTGAKGKLPRHHMRMPLEKMKFGTIPLFHVSTQVEGRRRSRMRGLRRIAQCRSAQSGASQTRQLCKTFGRTSALPRMERLPCRRV